MRIPRRPQRPLNFRLHKLAGTRQRRVRLSLAAGTALLFLLLALPACRSFRSVPTVSLPVPFLPQPPDHCGPTALLMVARYHGLDPDPDALDAATFIPALGGTTPEVLLHAAAAIGLPDARILPLSPSDPRPLFAAVDSGIPPILFLDPPNGADDRGRGHFLVVVGYQPTTRALLVHTGNSSTHPLPPSRYDKRLRTALLLSPPPSQTLPPATPPLPSPSPLPPSSP